jgi:hypothetical protein
MVGTAWRQEVETWVALTHGGARLMAWASVHLKAYTARDDQTIEQRVRERRLPTRSSHSGNA